MEGTHQGVNVLIEFEKSPPAEKENRSWGGARKEEKLRGEVTMASPRGLGMCPH